MYFPRSDVDVIKDTTTAFELSEALRSQETFNTRLNKSTDEKYQNSTLNSYVLTILNSKTDDERNTLIYQYYRPPAIYGYKISSRHFDDSIEGKWMAMIHLKFPITDWAVLTTKTIFENVIHIIFNECNNHVVLKFYKWAETKIANVKTFNTFVADTFVNFFWNCTSVRHGKNIVNFVRDKINLEELMAQRGIKIFNDKFDNKITTYHSLFTKKEFEILLFHTPKEVGEDNTNLITKICSCAHEQSIYLTFAAVPLKEIIEQVKISVYLVHSLLWFLVGTLDEQRNESVIKFITEFIDKQEWELVSNALGIMTSEGSFFHLAFTKRNMFMVKLVWKMAKSYLNEEQFRCLLLDPYNVYPNLVGNVKTNEFMDQPPGIQNTNCQTACFEFQSFKPDGAALPEFAISLNDNQIYIGRCKILNSDGYFLCKITLHEPVPVEVVGFSGMQPLNDSLEILIGKGIAWTEHTSHDRQLYFQFTQKLLKRHNNNILLVDEPCPGQHYLAYDDDAARQSAILNDFCYFQGRSLY
ncbi:uncharacterized protein LOC119085830 [Bradysia coprophila]|uniref:uncharacterized protein LOC119085830 n=1 Tax=Bradysia coprophila TaxID=38358 RepID=UPI00187DB358|nr:uncharacterized protein LOC119085830 [Bradysia coprophila]